MIAIDSPVPQFFDKNGDPLQDGYIYFGVANQNPETAPITVYWDTAGTQPVAQPVRTINGYVARSGTPANIFSASDYSITVKDKRGRLITYTPLATQFGNAGQIGNVVSDGQTITLNVPSQYATIQAALAAIQAWVIFGTVKIQVADGTYNLTSSIVLNHPFGDRIQLLGNVTFPDNCILRGPNPPTFDAIVCNNGNKFGLLNGFMVDLAVKATLSNNFTAILANNGGNITCGPKIKTNNWYYGIVARNGSFISCDFASANNSGDVGIWAFVGSTIKANFAISTNANDSANNLGYGFQAEYGSAMDCSNSIATGCYVAGIAALSGSTVRALTCTASTNTGSGFLARDGGTIENHNAIANNNTRYGEERITDGMIRGAGVTLTGNTIAASNGYSYLDNSGPLGARIAANGPFRIDNNGTDPIYMNTAGGLQAEVRSIATATSHYYMQGGNAGTGDQPIFGTDGTAADISGRVQLKGAGSFFVNNANGTQFSVSDGGAATVNRINARGSLAGSPVKLDAVGADAIIDIAILPKGAGSHVQFGSGFVASGVIPVTGYMEFKDDTGTIRKLLVG